MSNMSPETTSDETLWHRVREAITERWPHLNQDELAACENEVGALTQFVRQRVDTNGDEVESVVREFAPQESFSDRVSQTASEGMHQVSESAQFAYMRADECIAKRPTESVLTSFVAGIAIGATVTALWMRSRQTATLWDRAKSQSWT